VRLTDEHVFTIDALLGEVVDVGITPTGRRRVIPVVGGTVHGALEGRVLPGGADWNLERSDGSTELCARYELGLVGGAVVSVTNTAVHEAAPRMPILTTPRFEVGDGGPVWLRTGVFVGLLQLRAGGRSVRIDVHRVTVEDHR
jgi:hypothetical protein